MVRNTSMKHVGMTREAMREAVKEKLSEGSVYVMHLEKGDDEDKRKNARVRSRLLYFSRNAAVFERENGKTETFTYQELWKMFLENRIL